MNLKKENISEWLNLIHKWKEKYPICPKEYYQSSEQINPYVFFDFLSNQTGDGDIIIPEAGCNVTWGMQGYRVGKNQRLFTAFNHSPMGYGIPAAIGACLANNKKRVIPIIGDGGFMMNEQELATIQKHNLPIKIFVMNNEGYGMMKQTQEIWLDSRYVASSKESLYFPDLRKIAEAHGIKKTLSIKNLDELKEKIRETLDYEGPVLCDVAIHPNSRIYPKLTFGRPIEDSAPLLNRSEFYENMIVRPLDKK